MALCAIIVVLMTVAFGDGGIIRGESVADKPVWRQNSLDGENYYFYAEPRYAFVGEEVKVVFVAEEGFPDYNSLGNFSALDISGNNIEVVTTKLRRNCAFAMAETPGEGSEGSKVSAGISEKRYEFGVGELLAGNYAFNLKIRNLLERECGKEPVVENERILTFNFRVDNPPKSDTLESTKSIIEERPPIIVPSVEISNESILEKDVISSRKRASQGGQEQPLSGAPNGAQVPLWFPGAPGKQMPVLIGWVPQEQPSEPVSDQTKGDYNSDDFVRIRPDFQEPEARGVKMPDAEEPQREQAPEEILPGEEKIVIEKKQDSETKVSSNGVTATIIGKLEVDNNQLKLAGMAITVTPSAAAEKAINAPATESVQKITVQTEDGPVYVVETRKTAKLFWLIPVEVSITTKVDAQTAKIISVEKPWWSFLAG